MDGAPRFTLLSSPPSPYLKHIADAEGVVFVVAVLVVVEAEAIAHIEPAEDFHADGEDHAEGVRQFVVQGRVERGSFTLTLSQNRA